MRTSRPNRETKLSVNKVCVGTRVDPELAQAVRRLADQGNRTVSREVAEAIRRHVMLELHSTRAAVDGVSRAASRPATGPDSTEDHAA
jgi:predicted transcriptional regulator